MLLSEVRDILKAKVVATQEKLTRDVSNGCGSDFMSDVLAFSKEKAVLLTGLMNPQVIRTAEMMDFKAVIFVRGKKATEDIISLAEEKKIVVMETNYSMFSACGLLHSKGLGGDIITYDEPL